jgi:hypothetical protein
MCISSVHVVCSLANKQDCEGALDELDIVERLNVETVVNKHRCPTLVEMCTATAVKNSHRKLDPAIHNGFRCVVCIHKVIGDICLCCNSVHIASLFFLLYSTYTNDNFHLA